MSNPPIEPELERQGQRLARPAPPFLALAAILAVVGIVLVIVGHTWLWTLGIVFIVLAGPPAVVGFSLAGASIVTRWASRRRPFA